MSAPKLYPKVLPRTRATAAQYDALKAEAKRRNVTMSQVLRDLLDLVQLPDSRTRAK